MKSKEKETSGLPENNKDITADLLDFDISDDEDLIGSPEGPDGPEDKGDHPAIALLDMAISTGADYCKKERLPAPNTAFYDGFSRPFLNSALWHYFPDGSVPDDPRLGLVAGLAGLALACAPPAMALYNREEEKKKRATLEKKKNDPDKDDPRVESEPACLAILRSSLMVISLADRVKDAAVVLGMAGALLVTSASPQIRAAGFAAWVVGNSCRICVGRAARDRHLILLFGFYLVTAILGLWTAGGMI